MAEQKFTEGDEVVYSILLKNIHIKGASDFLANNGCPRNLHQVTPGAQAEKGDIAVPRLLTFWQGDAHEQAWQKKLTEHYPAVVTVAPWSPAPGYPIGDWDKDEPIASDKPPARKRAS